jgi:hypothetical protein
VGRLEASRRGAAEEAAVKMGLGVSLCNCLRASVLRMKPGVGTKAYTYTMTPLQPEPSQKGVESGELRVSNPVQPANERRLRLWLSVQPCTICQRSGC